MRKILNQPQPCRMCKEIKDPPEFVRHKGRLVGFIPVCRPCQTAQSQAWKLANPGKQKGIHFKHRHGVDLMSLPIRPERCEICKNSKPLDYDHSHQNREFRGWICRRCNLALGAVGDSVDLLAKM